MESRHCGQDKIIFFCPVHNASTPCSLQAFGIRCIVNFRFTDFSTRTLWESITPPGPFSPFAVFTQEIIRRGKNY